MKTPNKFRKPKLTWIFLPNLSLVFFTMVPAFLFYGMIRPPRLKCMEVLLPMQESTPEWGVYEINPDPKLWPDATLPISDGNENNFNYNSNVDVLNLIVSKNGVYYYDYQDDAFDKVETKARKSNYIKVPYPMLSLSFRDLKKCNFAESEYLIRSFNQRQAGRINLILIALEDDVKYVDFVQILDFCKIENTRSYAIRDVHPYEREAIRNFRN